MRVIKLVFIKSRFTRGLNPNKNNELHKNSIIKNSLESTIGCLYLVWQAKAVQGTLYALRLYKLQNEAYHEKKQGQRLAKAIHQNAFHDNV